MVSSVFTCGFECGDNSALGIHWALVGGSVSIETTTVRTGLRAVRCNPSASSESIRSTGAHTSTIRHIGRVYVYFVALPSADTGLVTHGSGSAAPQVRFKQSDSKIYSAVSTTFGATGVAVTTGQWYRLDYDFNVNTAGADFCDVQVDGVACGQATAAGTSTGSASDIIGVVNTATADVIFDDVILSSTAADYPIGAGFVKSYIPNADGAHNLVGGANDFERSATSVAITNSTTDAYDLINERPLPTTEVDFINAVAPPTTDYVEWAYEDSTEADAPRAVEAILVTHDAGSAGTCAYSVTLREHAGGTTADIFNSTQNVGATITYRRAHFATVPGTSDAWTTTKFNALRSRFTVTDASPDIYLDAAMLEAEFPEAAAVEPEYPNWVRTQHVPGMRLHPGPQIGRSW